MLDIFLELNTLGRLLIRLDFWFKHYGFLFE